MVDSSLFYRVEDECSQARTTDGRVICSGDRYASVDFKARHGRKLEALGRHVTNHLDWSNRRPTPFISMYNDDTVAFEEAERRKRRGMKNVTITVVDVEKVRGRVQFRNVRWLLAHRLGRWIPEKAWHNSKYEYIFLHYIPDRAVTERIYM
jgi:hypothetical protein